MLDHTTQNTFFLLSCLALLVSSMPYNGVGPFYNGDIASDPSFDIRVGDTFHKNYNYILRLLQEHLWPGLTVKYFTLGGK